MGRNYQNRRQDRRLPPNLPKELRLTLRQGKHCGKPQWQAKLSVDDPNFAQPVEARVVINEREWSGPLAAGETWIVRPNNYLPEHQLLFCDALYRAEDSAVTVERTWNHPLIIDMYERQAWDIRRVFGRIEILHFEWIEEQEVRWDTSLCRSTETGKTVRKKRVDQEKSLYGNMEALHSEAGWLVMRIEFSRDAPTDEDFYNVHYWTEEVRVPLCQCDPQWNLKSEFDDRGRHEPGKERRFADGSYVGSPSIITRDNRIIAWPSLFEGGERGSHGPFDPSKVGRSDNSPLKVDETVLNEQLRALMPGTLFRMMHRETGDAIGAASSEFIGIVRDVLHHTDGSWEIWFEKNQLWFRQPQWRREASWECVGKPQRDRDAYVPTYVVPSGQRELIGFQSLRFRRLVTPEHAEKSPDGWNLSGATHFDIDRDDSGRPTGFSGCLPLQGWMLHEQGATDRKQLSGQSLSVPPPSGVVRQDYGATIELYDLNYYVTCRDLARAHHIKLPDAIIRKLHW